MALFGGSGALPPAGTAEGALISAALAPPTLASTRRAPSTPVLDAVAQKLLLGYLQNRHQTLYPLRVNFRTLHAGQADLLIGMAAVAALAGRTSATVARERLEGWLRKGAAGSREREVLESALATPPALNLLIDRIVRHDLGAAAFVAALAGLDQRSVADRRFLDYLAARLDVPTDVALSLAQRYRF